MLPSGHLIRPQDVGGLTALGITSLQVSRRPKVSIVSTGDELVAPDQTPGRGRIRDINTYTISALVEKHGGMPVEIGLAKDDYEEQRAAAVRGLEQGDILIFSAGSSISSRDLTASVHRQLGEPRRAGSRHFAQAGQTNHSRTGRRQAGLRPSQGTPCQLWSCSTCWCVLR